MGIERYRELSKKRVGESDIDTDFEKERKGSFYILD